MADGTDRSSTTSATTDLLACLLSAPATDEQQAAAIVAAATELLAATNFSAAAQQLRGVVAAQQHTSVALDAVVGCLLWLQQRQQLGGETQQPPPPAAVVHLLLEAINNGLPASSDDNNSSSDNDSSAPAASRAPPPPRPAGSSSSSRAAAVQLMLAFAAAPDGAKLAAKVAAACSLGRSDVGSPQQWQQLADALLAMLQPAPAGAAHAANNSKSAVHLMMRFEGLDEVVDKAEVLQQLIADGQDALAQVWASSLGRDYERCFVDACIALNRLKPAVRAVRQLRLQHAYPSLEADYRRRSLARLTGKRLWPVAQSYAGSDAALQAQLVRAMADAGELLLAEEYRRQAGLPEDTLAPPDAAELAAQEAARRAAYLQLQLPPGGQLLWVADAAACAAAAELLGGSDVVGLDVEWKPSHTVGVSSPAALLQVATRTHAMLFDLLGLCQQQHTASALGACLGPIFAQPSVCKLGFEVAGDLNKLAGSWPQVQAFGHVAGVLDLRPLWVAHGTRAKLQGGRTRALSSVGLSTLCSALLGKPLDKSQQMSDWTARPLSERQQQYAALDAFVLPQLYDRLVDSLGPEQAAPLVRQHTKTLLLRKGAGGLASLRSQEDAAAGRDGGGGGAGGDVAAAPAASFPSRAAAGGGDVQPARGSTALGSVSDSTPPGDLTAGQQRVLALLQQHNLQDRFRRLTASSAAPATAAAGAAPVAAWDTAAALRVPAAAVAKAMTVLVAGSQQPHLVVVRGDQRVDLHQVACALGVKRRALSIAPQALVQQLTGFASGVPPIGHAAGSIRVLVDRRLAYAAASWPDTRSSAAAAASMPLGGGAASRGGLAVVGAAAATAAAGQQQEQQQNGADGGSSGARSGLFLQCGADAVVRLDSVEQLLLLSGADGLADVADASCSGEAAAGAPVSSRTATLGTGQAASASACTPRGGPVRLLLDSMLGRLCRWLRAAGVDAEFVQPPPLPHQQQPQQPQQQRPATRQQQKQQQQGCVQEMLVQQVQEAAMLQGRTFVTTNQRLAARQDIAGCVFLLSSFDPSEQLAELRARFGISLDEAAIMSRCSACNAAAYERISAEQAAPHVASPRILELVEDGFWQCGKCRKVVWMGPKSQAALQLLEGLFSGDSGRQQPTPLQRPQQQLSGDSGRQQPTPRPRTQVSDGVIERPNT